MSTYNTRSANQSNPPLGDELSGPPQLFPSLQTTHDHATPETSPLETSLPQPSQASVISQELISLRTLEVLERLSVQQSSSDNPSSPTTTTRIAKAPDAFQGSPKELENFLSSCVLYMDAYPGTFNSDKSRINFVISHCWGSVLQSLRPLINRADQPSLLHDYQEFLIYLRRHWADPDEKGNDNRELRGLRQKGSASDFFLRLNQLLAILDIPNDADLLVENTFYKLNSIFRDEIARNQDFDPKSIDELMDFIIKIILTMQFIL